MADTLFISCAEPSGDRLGAELVEALRRLRPGLEVRGCCGPRLRQQGADAVVRMEEVAVMGISAVLPRLPELLRARRRLAAELDKATVAVFIDGPSLHLPLARNARNKGTFTIGYVCPQVWAWKPERTAQVGAAFDRLLCLFDFEPPLLAAAMAVNGGEAVHVGHPLLDRLPPSTLRKAEADHIALLPGSRAQELDRHLSGFLQTAARVVAARPGTRVSLVSPEALDLPLPPGIARVDDIRAIQHCRAALTKSGTVTLELAWMGVPQLVAHHVAVLTHLVGRALVRHVDHVAMPNVLARRQVVPERLGAIDPGRLADELLALPEEQPVDLQALGEAGASARAARIVAAALAEHA